MLRDTPQFANRRITCLLLYGQTDYILLQLGPGPWGQESNVLIGQTKVLVYMMEPSVPGVSQVEHATENQGVVGKGGHTCRSQRRAQPPLCHFSPTARGHRTPPCRVRIWWP